jgi:hypothetical protein
MAAIADVPDDAFHLAPSRSSRLTAAQTMGDPAFRGRLVLIRADMSEQLDEQYSDLKPKPPQRIRSTT